MKNNFLKLLLTVLIIINLVALYGCVKVQTQKDIKKPGDTEVTQKPQYNTEDNGDPFKLQVTDPSYASIKEYVDAKADNWSASWSNDSTKVAFWIYDTNKDECRMYLWKVGENEPVYLGEETKDYYPCTFLWSPNDKYILADSGTSVLRIGYVITSEDFKLIHEFPYFMNPAWSPNSKHIAAAKRIQMETDVLTELEGTTDIVIIDILNKEEKTIDKGAKEYYFQVQEWQADGTLKYEKTYFQDNKSEVLSYRE